MRTHVATVLAIVLVLSSTCFAKIDSNLTGESLKDALASVVAQNHHAVGYNTARKDVMGQLSLEKKDNQYFIKDVYCEEDFASKGPGTLPNNSVLNVEHTWPQSKFGGGDKEKQKSDLHHLFPADSQMNGVRGNHPFGIVVHPTQELKCNISQLGENAAGQLVFEPPVGHRGNVARALFYFSIRYDMKIDSDQEAALRQWNQDDPVDEAEMERNNIIENLQGNRNPFIDQPELANKISDF